MIAIVLSFALAFSLEIVQFGPEYQAYNPPWAVMILIFWCWHAPSRVGVLTGFFIGLLLDVVKVETLGLNALGAALVAYLACRFQYQLRPMPVWQQSVAVAILVSIFKALVLWSKDLFFVTQYDWSYWVSVLTVLLVWPLLALILREFTLKAGRL